MNPFHSRVLVALCFMITAINSTHARSDKPNFIIILADDLGYGDLGCYGHPSIRTPNLDRMASEGMRFTDFYSTGEVCTPSRAALLTGRYPIRSGLCGDKPRVLTARAKGGLPADEITLAEALRERGYSTACIGKWHLGLKPEFNPIRHGFDYFFGLPHSNDMNPTNAPRAASGRIDQSPDWWNSPLYRNETIVEQPADQTSLTRRYTEEAVSFIKQKRRNPFFLYLPHTFPHVPLFASKSFHGKSERGLYGDVVEELDWSVGEILKAVRRENLEENTLVFFTSDNGPWLIQKLAGGSAGLLHEGKGSTWEGGMRVPMIAWWPGHIGKAQVNRDLACNMDFFVTCLKLSGGEPPKDRPMDGVDLAPLLFGKGRSQRENFFYYRGTNLFALRQGDYKAHFVTRSAYGKDDTERHDPPLLFNLRQDPGERFNIATNEPGMLARFNEAAERHRAGIQPGKSQFEEVER